MQQLFILLLLVIIVGCQSPTKETKQTDEQEGQPAETINITDESTTTTLAELPVEPKNFRKRNTITKPSISRHEPLNSMDAAGFQRFNQNDNLRLHGVKAGPVVSVFQNNASPRLFIDFENDIFTNTDYYYTNGVRIGFTHPVLSFPGNRLFPKAGIRSINEYGLSLSQKMYTGVDPETDKIIFTDRPFAGTLIAEYFRTSVDYEQKILINGSIQFGVIGKPSLASWIQKILHEKFPAGWDGQIRTDLLLNYNLKLDYQIHKSNLMQAQLLTEVRAGSYKTNAATGLRFIIGNMQSNIAENNSYPASGFHLPIWISAEAIGRFVYHDASLHGGLLNNSNPHFLNRSETNKLTFQLNLSTGFMLHKSMIALRVVYLSKEFKAGTDHRWGVISLSHQL